MLQIINAVLKDAGDKTEVRDLCRLRDAQTRLTPPPPPQLSLLFANQTEDDILCRKARPRDCSAFESLSERVAV